MTSRLQKRESRFAIALVIPVAIYLIIVMLFPLLWGIWLSFTNKTIGGPGAFVFLDNYKALLQSPEFHSSLRATLVYTISAIFFKTILGIVMALLLNMNFKGRGLVRALLLIPWTLPNLVAVLNWKWIFSDIGGALNSFLQIIGVTSKNIAWLGTGGLAMVAIVVVNVWRGTPFFGITILSKLQTIPKDWYEAAAIDGASPIQQFFRITLPSIKDIVLLSMLVSTIWTINDFESIWLMTGGGPVNSTAVITVFSYKTAIQSMMLGRAAAVSVIAMPILILLIISITRVSGRDEQ